MNAFEKPHQRAQETEKLELEDFLDKPRLHTLLARLPESIRAVHMARIEHLSEDEAEGYLFAIREGRNDALRESEVSDSTLAPFFKKHEKEIWDALETRVFTDAENHIGAGTTARIKSFDLNTLKIDDDEEVPTVAVKYLVTPTEKTLSVSGEHDLLLEIDQIRTIEAAEVEAHGHDTRIRVPHPYFYYQKGKIQCYAMERIDGINLEQGMSGTYNVHTKEELRTALKEVSYTQLEKEIDEFFDTMHEFCLHGDVKPRNLMVSRDGHFYVIDFGQSRLVNSIPEKAQDAFGEIKDMEKKQAKDAVRFFLDTLFRD